MRNPRPHVPALLLGAALLIPAIAGAQEIEWISHRGESADAPENTLAAVRLAWERGVPAAEIDVHLTRDGKLAVMHDANARRTTGAPLVIKDTDFAVLDTLDAGSWKDARWSAETVATLEEVLATIPEEGRLFIEIKVGAEAVPAVKRAIEGSGKRPSQLAIISFQADAVAEAKRQLPDIEAFYLSSFKQDSVTGAWSPTVDELIRTAKETRADGLDLSHSGPIDAAFVRTVKEAGLGLYVWTVDDPAIARRLIAAGIEGITTNRAAALRREVAGK